jgi:hypothetical protein
MKEYFISGILFLLIATGVVSAPRQSAHAFEVVPRAEKFLVPAAELMRVDEGVFDLKFGGTIDLTNRRILLAVVPFNRKCCAVTLNGESVSRNVGARINLKEVRATAQFVEDKNQCFLDITDFVEPQGSTPIYTFRFHCL